MEDRLSLFDRSFSLIIAFVLPGLVALAGAAAVNDTVNRWFQGAQSAAGVVGLLFVVLAALALGVILSALRFLFFEQIFRRYTPARVPFDEARRSEHAKSYAQLQADHYYHYLASGNMAMAVPLAFITWFVGSPTRTLWGWALVFTILATIALVAAAADALKRYQHRRAELLPKADRTAA